MKRVLLVFGLVTLLIGSLPAQAQMDDTTIVVHPLSVRYRLEIPADWQVSTEELRGLTGTFIGEIVAVADSAEAMQSLGTNDPAAPVIGQTLLANVFPTASATRGQPISDANEIFRLILGDDVATAEFLEINGMAAVRVDDYPGPPYESAAFAGLTMILDGELIYYLVYGGPDQDSLERLEQITATLSPYQMDPATLIDGSLLGSREVFRVGSLEIPMSMGWLVMSLNPPQPTPDRRFMIMPEPDISLRHAMGFGAGAELPGLFIQVHATPYDSLYGTSDYVPTGEDRSFVLGQELANTGGEPQLDTQELLLDGFPALRLEMTGVFGGDNQGVIVLLDGGQSMHTVTFVAPAGRWADDYLPLVEMLIDNLTIAPLLETGLQVGQVAPDFTATLLDGTPVALSDYRGSIVILNFWATWCGPCRVEMPEFQVAYETGLDDFTILAVNLMETPEQIQVFVDELGLIFPIALDPRGEINNQFDITAYPSTYVIDRQGVIRVVHYGPALAGQVQDWLALAND